MKLAIFFATAISTAVLAAEERLDVRSCVCSSTTSSCHCQDAETSVQVLSDVVPKCVASRRSESSEDVPYPDNPCGVARKYADVACIVSRNPGFPGDWCGGSQKRADAVCSPARRSVEGDSEAQLADACTRAQKRAIMCIVSRTPEDPFPGDWCGGTIDAVNESCGITAASEKRTDGFPGDWCGRRRIDCITSRTPEASFPGDWCGGSLRLARDCIGSRSPEGDFPGDWCGKRNEHCRVSRSTESKWCSSVQKRAEHCIVSRGWKGYPWDICDSTDVECIAAAERELGYEMEVKREPASADACDYSARGGRRAVTPPHCMCPAERDEAGADAVKRCRCGEDAREVATKYHCMCLTGEGDVTAPCACNSDVAFLSEVEYEQ